MLPLLFSHCSTLHYADFRHLSGGLVGLHVDVLKIKVQILPNFAKQKPVRAVISMFIQTVSDDLPDFEIPSEKLRSHAGYLHFSTSSEWALGKS